MVQVVDSLIVTLGLDPANFTKGQKEAAEALRKTQNQASRTAKEMAADGARAAEFFGAIKTEALSLIGVLIGSKGLESFVRDQTKSLADLGREAKNIGVSVPVLAAFRDAIERNGGSAEAATASFQNLTDAMEHLKVYGNSPMLPFLNLIGAARGDDAMTTYMKFVQFAQDHANDVQLIRLVGKGLGLDPSSINEAMKGVAKVRADLARSLALDGPTPSMTEHAKEFQEALVAMGQAAKFDGDMLLDKMYPGLIKVTDAMTVLIQQNPAALAGLAAIAGYLTVIAGLNFKSVIAFLARIFPAAALPLVLKGDEGPNSAGVSPEQEEINRRQAIEHGAITPREWWHRNMPTWLGGGGNAPLADPAMTPEQQNFLKSLSGPESGGRYDIKNGWSPSNDNAATRFSDFSKFPEGVAPGGTSTAAGRYQFTSSTWQDVSQALGLHDFSPASQDRGAWYLADREYRKNTGRDLQADLKTGGHDPEIATALKGRWPSLPGGSQYHGTTPNGVPKAGPIFGTPPIIPPAPPRLAPPIQPSPTDNSTQVTVNGLVVHTQAKDSPTIARDIHRSLITQADSGPQ